MRSFKVLTLFACVALIFITGCERKVTEQVIKEVAATDAAYIGTDACQACHADIHASFVKSGHPFKLNDASEAFTPGYYPFTTLPTSGPELDLSQAMMVIGGFRWKARFIDSLGYIMTGEVGGAGVQYNFETDAWVGYHAGEEQKPYGSCGPCHMTNWKPEGFQDGLPGLNATWEANGIQCEECHGPGELHAGDPYEIAMKIDRSNEACGKCHIRGTVEAIPASGGFVKHHEQWNEMFQSKHATLQCVDCHNVHESLHPLNPNKDNAIKVNCENCHGKEAASYASSGINHAGSNNGPSCVDCHMPRAAKSAVAVGEFEGDVRSHMFGINTAADAEMFTEDGAFAIGDLTVEYMCLQCHNNENKSWASTNAGRVHGGDIAGGDDCFTCHGDSQFGLVMVAIQEQYEFSVHGSSANTDRNRLASGYYQSCERCHTSEGFIAEVTGIPATGENFSAIGCFTCHAPHSDGNFGVRVMDAVTLADGTTFDRGLANTCVTCHQSRRDVSTYVAADTTGTFTIPGHFGPHYGNQGDMLIGANAYEYDGYVYSNSAHVNVATNGCVDCHMSPGRHASVGGHSWNMENETSGFELITGCNEASCHNGDVANLNFDGVQTQVHNLLDSLQVRLLAAGFVDVDGHSISGVVIPSIDSAGALYNFIYVEEDRSFGVHNTDYVVGLLQSAINFLDTGNPNGVAAQLISAHK